jgi:rod shape determining protein RodA
MLCLWSSCGIFLSFVINVGMTMGLAPVIGIPLPLSVMEELPAYLLDLLFILIRLDADRQMVLR